jgi:hypothetical protein
MFKAINHILFENPSKEIDSETLEEFVPYMVTRYFSFYENGKYIDYINSTINKYQNIFYTKEDEYKFYENVIPKLKNKKINYIKKNKKEKTKKDIVKTVPDFYSRKEWENLTSNDI